MNPHTTPPPRAPLTPWIILLPSAAFSQFFVQAEGPWVGLLQRLMVGVISAWIVMVALRVQVLVAGAQGAVPVTPGVDARYRGDTEHAGIR